MADSRISNLTAADFISDRPSQGLKSPVSGGPPSETPKPLYAARPRIYPKSVKGTFRNAKWVVMAVTLGIYYLLPWIRWERGPGMPSQAFLLDFANQRLFFGPIEIWAQEFYYVTGLLIIGALSLFLVTSVAGRMWCGYTCPQTVWTDLMVTVERFWQGDRSAHLRREALGWTFGRVWRGAATHISWLAISIATGGAFVFYFRDAPTLASEFATGDAPFVAYMFAGIFTATTYILGGFAREQVCIYMCPWPRIQGAMLDGDSLLVSYRDVRGEPRAAHKKGESWEGRGDCIDCNACVAVCPTGTDIRMGSQLECIQCALCIDACNDIMDRIGRPRGLIAYATYTNAHNQAGGARDGWRLVRPRTVLYSAMIAIVGTLMLWALLTRPDAQVTISPDRNPLFVILSDGGIRNGYTVKIMNKRGVARGFHVHVRGRLDAKVDVLGLGSDDPLIEVPPADLRPIKVFVTLPAVARKELKGDALTLELVIADASGTEVLAHEIAFRGPAQ